MADRYWVGTTTSWNTASNWASTSGGAGGAGVPTSADAVIFDGGGTGNCTLDVDAQTIASIDVQSGYTGTLDFADSGYTFTVSGNVTFAGGGTVDFGDATITVGGNTNITSQTTFDRGNSTLVLTGAGKTLSAGVGQPLFNVSISGSISTSGSFLQYPVGSTFPVLTVSGTLTIYGVFQPQGNILVTSSGTINARVDRLIQKRKRGYITVQAGGQITGVSQIQIYDSDGFGQSLAGTFDSPVLFQAESSNTLTIDADALFNATFTAINAGTIAGNDQDITFADDVSITTTSWSKGTGTITLSGSANQNIDFDGESVEDIVIDKTAGTVTLTGGVVTDSLTLTSGTLDCGSQSLETVGNFTMAAGTTVTET